MRIAYIAPYQGPTLAKRRPIVRNFSLGSRVKVELIAEQLQRSSHTLEIFSQGEVIETRWEIYPAFAEAETFNTKIPVDYASALPVKFLNGFWSSRSTLQLFKTRHRACQYDMVMIYNLKPPQVACARYAIRRLDLPVILEYEDDQFLGADEEPSGTSLTSRLQLLAAKRLLGSVSGCIAGSPDLLSQVPGDVPKLLLPGVVSEEIVKATEKPKGTRCNWVVFSGTHSPFQGLEQLIQAWRMAKLQDWELHIAGHGQMTTRLHELAEGDSTIVFHGVLNREENAKMLSAGKITVVAYEVSQTRGFSFKTVECLGAGLHVITTPLRALEGLEPEMKVGITYINDNLPETIAACLKKVIVERRYEHTARQATLQRYGPAAASQSLDTFLKQVMTYSRVAKNGQRSLSSVY